MATDAYNRLLRLFTASGEAPLRPEEGNAGGDRFNAWSGQVAAAVGATDWESLPEDFETRFSTNQAGAKLLSGDTLFNTVSKTTNDFFSTFGGPPAAVTSAGAAAPVAAGGVTGFLESIFKQDSPALATPPAQTVAPASSSTAGTTPAAATSSPPLTLTGGAVGQTGPFPGTGDLLSNIAGGNNLAALTPAGAPAVNITSSTYAPSSSTFNYDQSTRTNLTYTSTINQPDLVKNVLDGIRGFFGTAQAAPGSLPMNDAAYTSGAMFPGKFAIGQSINGSLSQPVSSDISTGTITGLDQAQSPFAPNRLLLFLALAGVVIGLYTLFRRR